MMKRYSVVLAAAGLVSLGACKSREFNQNKSEVNIVGGSPLGPWNPGRTNAVALYLGDKFFCSGALVAEDLVMTAAHCLQHERFRDGLKDLRVAFGGNPGEFKYAEGVAIQPLVDPIRQTIPAYDVGWVRIKKPAGGLPYNYKPLPVLPQPKFVDVMNAQQRSGNKEKLVLVGFGKANENDKVGGQRRTMDTYVSQVFTDAMRRYVFEVGPTPGQGACFGDSGGPAYWQDRDGSWYIAGLTHGFDPMTRWDIADPIKQVCRQGVIWYTSAGAYQSWVEESAKTKLIAQTVAPLVPPEPNRRPETFEEWCMSWRKNIEQTNTVHRMIDNRDHVMTWDCKKAAAYYASIENLENPITEYLNVSMGDIQPIAALRQLKSLSLPGNRFSDISSLANLTRLEQLDLSNNALTNLDALRGLASLQSVHVPSNHQLTNINGVLNLPHLKALNIGETGVRDLRPFATATAPIEDLALNLLGIERPVDVSPLAGLKTLKKLSLGSQKIQGLANLATLPALELLDLYDAEVADVRELQPLDSIPTLQQVNVRGLKVGGVNISRSSNPVCPFQRVKCHW